MKKIFIILFFLVCFQSVFAANDCANFAGDTWGGRWKSSQDGSRWAFGVNKIEGETIWISLRFDKPNHEPTHFFQGTCKDGTITLNEATTETHLEGYIIRDEILVLGKSKEADVQLMMTKIK